MSWPKKLEKEWQIFISSLIESPKGFFLLLYDRKLTCEAVCRRLKNELTDHGHSLVKATLADRVVYYIKSKLEEDLANFVLIKIDKSNSSEEIQALNLLRETLYELPVNYIFLIQESMYSQVSSMAHDLTTWFKLPYSFALPDIQLPAIPPPEKTLMSEASKARINYYREQIQNDIEQGEQASAFQTLALLADLYLEVDMYQTALSIYNFLIESGIIKDKYFHLKEKSETAEGWKILSDLNTGSIPVAEQYKLKKFINAKKFSVEKAGEGVRVVDSFGNEKPFSIEFFIRLGLLSETIQDKLLEIIEQSTDPTLLLLDAEKAYKYSATRYGIGYDLTHVKLRIDDDGSATLQRTVNVEAYSKIDVLDTYLVKTEENDAASQSGLQLVYIESLNPDNVIKLEDQKDDLSRRLSTVMAISPQLGYGESITYDMMEKTSPSLFATSGAELAKRESPFDHFGWSINRPTRRLVLEVSFPEGCQISEFKAEVKLAGVGGFPSTQPQLEEQKRLREFILLDKSLPNQTLKFELLYPMTGLIYILNWQLK